MDPLRRTVTMLLVLMACRVPAGAQEGNTVPGGPTVTATGTGEVQVAPDLAQVRFGAVAQESAASAAQARVNAVVEQILAAVQELGVPAERVQTSGISLYPVYAQPRADEEGDPRIVGYRASNTISVEVLDVAQVGAVIDAGIQAGANQLEGVSFSLQDEAPEQRTALERAVQDARAKAEAMARALGMRLGPVLHAREGTGESVQPIAFQRMERAATFAGTPVEPGQLTVTAMVTIRYALLVGG